MLGKELKDWVANEFSKHVNHYSTQGSQWLLLHNNKILFVADLSSRFVFSPTITNPLGINGIQLPQITSAKSHSEYPELYEEATRLVQFRIEEYLLGRIAKAILGLKTDLGFYEVLDYLEFTEGLYSKQEVLDILTQFGAGNMTTSRLVSSSYLPKQSNKAN
jgi:hypothetical protein